MQGSQVNNGGQQQPISTGAPKETQSSQTSQQQQQPQRADQPISSLRSMGSRFSNLMPSTPGSEILSKLTNALTEIYGSVVELKTMKVELIPVSYKDTRQLKSSFILVAMQDPANVKLGVAFHALVLEDDSDINTSLTETWRSETYPILKVASDNIDDVMIGYFSEVISKRYRIAPELHHYADACVVPTDFPVTDTRALYRLAANAINAVATELTVASPDFSYIDLSKVKKDTGLQVQMAFRQSPTLDATSLPVRSDIIIDFRSVPLQQNGQQSQTDNTMRNSEFSTLTAFVDLVYEPAQQNQMAANQYQQYNGQNQQQDLRLFTPRIVITSLFSDQATTIGDQLIALSTIAPLLGKDMPWVRHFMPQHMAPTNQNSRTAGFDPYDIGALALEAGFTNAEGHLMAMNTTDPQEFGDKQFWQYFSRLVRPAPAVAVDIPESGDSTWYNRILMAVLTDPAARAALIKAADAITGNAFSQYFSKTDGAIVLFAERVHMGYYTNSAQVKCDIRDVDGLYLLNKNGTRDPALAQRWTESFRSEYRPNFVNMFERRQMIEQAVVPTYTGFAQRLTLAPGFLQSLDLAMAACGMTPRIKSGSGDMGMPMRGFGNLDSSGAVMRDFNSAAFGYGAGPSYSNNHRGGFNPRRF